MPFYVKSSSDPVKIFFPSEQGLICSLVRNAVGKKWEVDNEPLLLSDLPKKIAEIYRSPSDRKKAQEIIEKMKAEEGWKKFLMRTAGQDNGYEIISHPTQLAKVGLVPYGSKYVFPPESESDKISKKDVLGFVKIIKSLDDKTIRSMNLPAKLFITMSDVLSEKYLD